jgi:hypothetical protein
MEPRCGQSAEWKLIDMSRSKNCMTRYKMCTLERGPGYAFLFVS